MISIVVLQHFTPSCESELQQCCGNTYIATDIRIGKMAVSAFKYFVALMVVWNWKMPQNVISLNFVQKTCIPYYLIC